MRLLLTGAFNYSIEQIKQIEELGFNVTFVQDEIAILTIDPSTFEVVVCNNLFLNNDIANFKKLRYIQTTSAGLDRIPLLYANEHNIQVFNAGNTYSIPIAEFAIMQILNIYKNTRFFIKNQFNKEWIVNRKLHELSDKQALILGYGNIGKEISNKLKPFVNTIYAYDIRPIKTSDVVYVKDYVSILDSIDILIVTLPLNDETKNIINKDLLEKMKYESVIVNLSRGKLLNEEDLICQLEKGKFLGVALDVFQFEPLSQDSRLWNFENVYITPHNSYVSVLNNDRLFKTILHNLRMII